MLTTIYLADAAIILMAVHNKWFNYLSPIAGYIPPIALPLMT